MSRAGVVPLRRDGVTWLLYAQFSAFAYFLYAFAPSVTLLRDDEGLRDTLAGLHGTAYAAGVFAVGTFGQRVIARTGRDRGMWIFLGGLCAGIAVYASVPVFPVTLAGAALLGASASGVALTCAAALVDHHGPAGGAATTEANGVAALFGLLGPLAVGTSVRLGLGWRPAMLIVVPTLALLYLVRRGFVRMAGGSAGRDTPTVPEVGAADLEAGHPAAGGGRLGRQFWLSALVVVFCVAIEFCVTLWCAQLLRDRSGLSSAAAATGVTAIVAGMAGGRFVGTRLARMYGADGLLGAAFALTAVGFALFWTATAGWLAFTGLVMCGLGMSLHYPLGVARAIRAAGGAADLASARIAAGTGIAIGGAPFLLGLLADLVTVRYAFLLVPALLAAAGVTLYVAHRRRDVAAPTLEPALVP